MIAAARKRLPDIAFEVAGIEGWPGAGFDVILANAVIQWIPDHEALIPALVGKLAPGGALAVQTPDNLDEPSHRLMREVAADGPWAAKLADAAKARAERRSADWYFGLLRRHAARVDIWRTAYFHPLAGAARHRRVGEGHRPPALPRPAGRRRARRLPRPLRGRDRRGLSGGGRRDGAPAVPEALLRRDPVARDGARLATAGRAVSTRAFAARAAIRIGSPIERIAAGRLLGRFRRGGASC